MSKDLCKNGYLVKEVEHNKKRCQAEAVQDEALSVCSVDFVYRVHIS